MLVLVVDDVSDNAILMQRFLKRRGHEVHIAENGQEGVEKALVLSPDMIFMDISMPVMSGIEATRIIRETPNIADVPIIALTAHAMSEDRKN